jgi:hypothetical protein
MDWNLALQMYFLNFDQLNTDHRGPVYTISKYLILPYKNIAVKTVTDDNQMSIHFTSG